MERNINMIISAMEEYDPNRTVTKMFDYKGKVLVMAFNNPKDLKETDPFFIYDNGKIMEMSFARDPMGMRQAMSSEPIWERGDVKHDGTDDDNCLEHHGIRGQKWGVRRWQNQDGSLTPDGKVHYGRNGKNKTVGGRLDNDRPMTRKDLEQWYKGGESKFTIDQFKRMSSHESGDFYRDKNGKAAEFHTLEGATKRQTDDLKENMKANALYYGAHAVIKGGKKVMDKAYDGVNMRDAFKAAIPTVAKDAADLSIGLAARGNAVRKINKYSNDLKSGKYGNDLNKYYKDVNYAKAKADRQIGAGRTITNAAKTAYDIKNKNYRDAVSGGFKTLYNAGMYSTKKDLARAIKNGTGENREYILIDEKKKKVKHSALGGKEMSNELMHYGTKGQKWDRRRYQNPDGTWTPEGLARRRATDPSYSGNDDKKVGAKRSSGTGRRIAKGAAIAGGAAAAIGAGMAARRYLARRPIKGPINAKWKEVAPKALPGSSLATLKKGSTELALKGNKSSKLKKLAIAGGAAAALGAGAYGIKKLNDKKNQNKDKTVGSKTNSKSSAVKKGAGIAAGVAGAAAIGKTAYKKWATSPVKGPIKAKYKEVGPKALPGTGTSLAGRATSLGAYTGKSSKLKKAALIGAGAAGVAGAAYGIKKLKDKKNQNKSTQNKSKIVGSKVQATESVTTSKKKKKYTTPASVAKKSFGAAVGIYGATLAGTKAAIALKKKSAANKIGANSVKKYSSSPNLAKSALIGAGVGAAGAGAYLAYKKKKAKKEAKHDGMDGLYLAHHGVKGQKWGVRRYQNSDGSWTDLGNKRRRVGYSKEAGGKVENNEGGERKYKPQRSAINAVERSISTRRLLGGGINGYNMYKGIKTAANKDSLGYQRRSGLSSALTSGIAIVGNEKANRKLTKLTDEYSKGKFSENSYRRQADAITTKRDRNINLINAGIHGANAAADLIGSKKYSKSNIPQLKALGKAQKINGLLNAGSAAIELGSAANSQRKYKRSIVNNDSDKVVGSKTNKKNDDNSFKASWNKLSKGQKAAAIAGTAGTAALVGKGMYHLVNASDLHSDAKSYIKSGWHDTALKKLAGRNEQLGKAANAGVGAAAIGGLTTAYIARKKDKKSKSAKHDGMSGLYLKDEFNNNAKRLIRESNNVAWKNEVFRTVRNRNN